MVFIFRLAAAFHPKPKFGQSLPDPPSQASTRRDLHSRVWAITKKLPSYQLVLQVKLTSAKHLLRGFDFSLQISVRLCCGSSPALMSQLERVRSKPPSTARQRHKGVERYSASSWTSSFFTVPLMTPLKPFPSSSLPSLLQPTRPCSCSFPGATVAASKGPGFSAPPFLLSSE